MAGRASSAGVAGQPGAWRRAQHVVLACGLGAVLLVPGGPSAAAAVTVERAAGADRYETAVRIARVAFSDPAPVTRTYLATGEGFADALSAGAAAAERASPVLLTARERLPAATREELRRLQPDEVVIVGGPAAVSPAVATTVANDPAIGASVSRLAGNDRYETAARISLEAFPGGAGTVYVATGTSFADALAGGAAAARFRAPLLLVLPDAVPGATRAAVQQLGPQRIVVLGGVAAVSDRVAGELATLASDVDRLAGASRYDTAAAVSADAFVAARTVLVATGEGFADALAGGPAAARLAAPLLLTPRSSLPDTVATELRALNPRRVIVLGGPAAVTDDVLRQIRRALEQSTALPDGTVPALAYVRVGPRPSGRSDELQTIAVATLDGAHEILTNPPPGTFDVAQRFSPDGTRVAFARADRRERHLDELLVLDVAVGAGSVRQLTNHATSGTGCGISSFDWHPGGRQLAYVCADRRAPEGGRLPGRTFVVDLRGNVTAIEPPDPVQEDIEVAFGPDGHLTISRLDPAAPGIEQFSRLVAVDPADPAGVPAVLHASADGRLLLDATWAADGSVMVAAEVEITLTGQRGTASVVAVRSDATVVRLLDNPDAAAADARGVHVVDGVTPAGHRVLVRTLAVDGPEGRQSILRLVRVADGQQTTLVGIGDLDRGTIVRAALAPDGSAVLYDDVTPETAERYRDGQVWRVAADGSGRARVDLGPANNAQPSWDPALFAGG